MQQFVLLYSKLHHMNFHLLKIHSVDRLSTKAVSIQFEIPEHLSAAFDFLPGQYVTLSYNTKEGETLRRSYSISNLPKERLLQIGVKELEKGAVFSAIANRELKAGDVIEVSEPEGRFVFDANDGSRVVAFAAGSGITPILSIARSALESHQNSRLLLVLGNTDAASIMYRSALEDLQQKSGDRFVLKHAFSRSNEGDYFGRIDKAIINHSLKAEGGVAAFDMAYLCGPEPLIHECKAVLSATGMDEESIHFELFTASEEKHDVTTEGEVEIKVILDDKTYTVNGSADEFILDLLLEEGVDAPYSCQGGTCSSCICKIQEGAAEMERNQVLTEKEIANGFVLSCQAKATTSSLTIDYDNV